MHYVFLNFIYGCYFYPGITVFLVFFIGGFVLMIEFCAELRLFFHPSYWSYNYIYKTERIDMDNTVPAKL